MMKNHLVQIILTLFLVLITAPVLSTNYYVSASTGDNSNPGTLAQPFLTIEKAVSKLSAGDSCFIMEGTYREEVQGNFMRASAGSPIVIQAYPGHEVILDGTVDIEAEWELYSGNIYKATIDTSIWQLFVEDEMMTSARWPNVDVFSDDTWSRKGWSRMHSSSTLGTMVDDPSWTSGDDLAGQETSFDGAMAVLNLNYWVTGVSKVEDHEPGSNHFSYDPAGVMQDDDMFKFYDFMYRSFYFIEGSLACLDAPGEWYFNPETRELYVWTKTGESPSGKRLRGKTQTYAFKFISSSYVKLRGIKFFGTTFSFKNCFNITVEDCHLDYPSYSKRMLGAKAAIAHTQFINADMRSLTGHKVRNCEFAYTDGTAIEIKGKGNMIENCLFHNIDYSCHGPWYLKTISCWFTQDFIFRNNTIFKAGNSEAVGCGESGLYEFNEVYNCGMLQGDGAVFDFTPSTYDGSIVRRNWVHDTYKRGIRLDDNKYTTFIGANAAIHHNVTWNCQYQGIQGKGDKNSFFNNLMFDNPTVDYNLRNNRDDRLYNRNTLTYNNISGNVSINEKNTDDIILGESGTNWVEARTSSKMEGQLRDMENRDFRLRPSSSLVDGGTLHDEAPVQTFLGAGIDIGPYEFGDTSYWIPGRKLVQASHPIPGDGSSSHYEFVDLIWREAYKALSYDIYFGTDSLSVVEATHASSTYQGAQGNNIFNPGGLIEGATYFWRVDAVREGVSIKGELWNFKAGMDSNPPVFTIKSLVYSRKDGEVLPLDSADILLDKRKARSNSEGSSSLTMVKAGEYLYSLSRKGYVGRSDSVHISADTTLTDTLEYTTYKLKFLLCDLDSEEAIAGGEIRFGELVLTTDSAGMAAVFDVPYAWYWVESSAEEYRPLERTLMEVYSDTTMVLALEKDYASLLLKITDKASGDPVYRAILNYGDIVLLSNHQGELSVDNLPKEKELIFSIKHNDYHTYTDSLFITDDTSMDVQLTALLASIRFEVSSAEGTLPGAIIKLDEILSQATDASGIVNFLSRPTRHKYGFTIEKEGYELVSDSLYLETDTLVSLELTPLSGIDGSGLSDIRVYPNPFGDYFVVETSLRNAQAKVIGMDGKMVACTLLPEGANKIDMKNLPSGIYTLFISAGDYHRYFKLISNQ